MKRSKLMFISGLLLTIGSAVLLPMIGVAATLIMGDDLDRFLNSNEGISTAIIAVLIGIAVLVPMAGVALMIGSVLLPLFANMRAKSRILSAGHPAEAKILDISDTGTYINNNPLVNISLEVYPPAQQPFRTQLRQTISMIHLPSYQPGKLLNVKYIPGTNEVAIVGAKL